MTSASPETLSRLRRIRHGALDMDGTIYRGKTLYSFTNGILARMAELGIGCSLLPNNSSKSVADDAAHLRRIEAGAVGEVCGRFFDHEGRECRTPWSDRVISMGLDQLRRLPQSIGIVAGADRSAALAAAVGGGLVKSLVMADHSARARIEAF